MASLLNIRSFKIFSKDAAQGDSLVVQWLEFHAFMAEGMGSILGWGTNLRSCKPCGVSKKKKKISTKIKPQRGSPFQNVRLLAKKRH